MVKKAPVDECPECGYDEETWAYYDEGENKEWTCADCGEEFSGSELS